MAVQAGALGTVSNWPKVSPKNHSRKAQERTAKVRWPASSRGSEATWTKAWPSVEVKGMARLAMTRNLSKPAGPAGLVGARKGGEKKFPSQGNGFGGGGALIFVGGKGLKEGRI